VRLITPKWENQTEKYNVRIIEVRNVFLYLSKRSLGALDSVFLERNVVEQHHKRSQCVVSANQNDVAPSCVPTLHHINSCMSNHQEK
jgi:hypothetical protein